MGIGGGERLVADAAVALRQRGWDVTLFVPDRESVEQFPELAAQRIPFRRSGSFLPSTVGGRLRVPLAVARAAYAGWRMCAGRRAPDVIFCDVVPHVIPLIRRWTNAPVLYFCHFPDLLLTADGSRDSSSYRAYRQPLDRLERNGIARASRIVTNSRFTARMVREVFPAVPSDKLTVLHPGVAVSPAFPVRRTANGEILLLSINRFDPRKNLRLALESLAALRALLPPATFSRVRLLLAGHYDPGFPESVTLVGALRQYAADRGLADQVQLALSPSEHDRHQLLARCRCVIYTPRGEHYGYVPVEAMAAGRPVVAVGSGGPLETVQDGVTGFLCDPSPDAFASALARLIEDDALAERMGHAAHAHAARHFSLTVFGDTLHRLAAELATPGMIEGSRKFAGVDA